MDRHTELKRVAVFCGANAGNQPEYIQCAKELGAELVKRNIGLLYGGTMPSGLVQLRWLTATKHSTRRRQCGYDGSHRSHGILVT